MRADTGNRSNEGGFRRSGVMMEVLTAGASSPASLANTGQLSQSTIQIAGEAYTNITLKALSEESEISGRPIALVANAAPETPEDQTTGATDPKQECEQQQILENGPSTQTKQGNKHQDITKQPSHLDKQDYNMARNVGQGTEAKDNNLGLQDTNPDNSLGLQNTNPNEKNLGGKTTKKLQDEDLSRNTNPDEKNLGGKSNDKATKRHQDEVLWRDTNPDEKNLGGKSNDKKATKRHQDEDLPRDTNPDEKNLGGKSNDKKATKRHQDEVLSRDTNLDEKNLGGKSNDKKATKRHQDEDLSRDTNLDEKNLGGKANDKKATKKHLDEELSNEPTFRTSEDAAYYYLNRYKKLRSRNERLANSGADLATKNSNLATTNINLHSENDRLRHTNKQLWNENSKFRAETPKLQRALEEEKNRNKQLQNENTQFRAETPKLQQALDGERKCLLATTKQADQLKEKLDDLYRSHIHSVNSVNTGLDSISDQTFEGKFDSIRDEIQKWCRNAFKQQPTTEIRSTHELAPALQKALDERRYPNITLRFRYFVETVIWIIMEDWILSPWFPAFDTETREIVMTLDSAVRLGDASPTLEKAEYWRAYTVSLLFQNPQIQKLLQNVKQESDDLLNILLDVQVAPYHLPPEYISELQRILRNLRMLRAQLRCQRAVYEVDHSVTVGEEYDESRMQGVQVAELENIDPKEETALVSCILSNGIVKKKYEASPEIEAWICRARVLIAVVPITR